MRMLVNSIWTDKWYTGFEWSTLGRRYVLSLSLSFLFSPDENANVESRTFKRRTRSERSAERTDLARRTEIGAARNPCRNIKSARFWLITAGARDEWAAYYNKIRGRKIAESARCGAGGNRQSVIIPISVLRRRGRATIATNLSWLKRTRPGPKRTTTECCVVS